MPMAGLFSTADEAVPKLPTLSAGHAKAHVIDPSVLIGLINGEYVQDFDDFVIIDCRFPYEYGGGHIRGAVNCPGTGEVDRHFYFSAGRPTINGSRTAVVFHCEFSCKRGPLMCVLRCNFCDCLVEECSFEHPFFFLLICVRLCRYGHLRKLDRAGHISDYPKLDYPHIFLLDGGYCAFFKRYKVRLCVRLQYV